MHSLYTAKGKLKKMSMKRLASTYGDLFTEIAAQVPILKAEIHSVTETRASSFGCEDTVPAIDIHTTARGLDRTVRMMTYWQHPSGGWVRACGMCINGFRAEYKHISEGCCYHCGGTNIAAAKGAKGELSTWPTRDKAIEAARRVSQSDLTAERTQQIFFDIHRAKVAEYWEQHPEADQARKDYAELVDEASRVEYRTNPVYHGRSDITEEGYLRWRQGDMELRVNRFAGQMLNEVEEKASLTPRQHDAFIASVAKTVAREQERDAQRAQVKEATKHVGEVAERLRFKAVPVWGTTCDSFYGTSVLMVMEGTGKYAGAKFKFFGSGEWLFSALEALEEEGPAPELTLSGTVKAHRTDAERGNLTELTNVRTIKKL